MLTGCSRLSTTPLFSATIYAHAYLERVQNYTQ